jgi:hypothetical protein
MLQKQKDRRSAKVSPVAKCSSENPWPLAGRTAVAAPEMPKPARQSRQVLYYQRDGLCSSQPGTRPANLRRLCKSGKPAIPPVPFCRCCAARQMALLVHFFIRNQPGNHAQKCPSPPSSPANPATRYPEWPCRPPRRVAWAWHRTTMTLQAGAS